MGAGGFPGGNGGLIAILTGIAVVLAAAGYDKVTDGALSQMVRDYRAGRNSSLKHEGGVLRGSGSNEFVYDVK